MNLIYIVILGFGLFFAMQLIHRMARMIPGDSRWRDLLLRSLPLAEFVVWITFAFWAAANVFAGLPIGGLVQSVMAVVLVAVLGWYVLRDFLNGILLKSENDFRKGQFIKTSFVSGRILSLGYRALQLETDKGEKVRIPYSRLAEGVITRPPQKGQSHTHMLSLAIQPDQERPLLTAEVLRELVNMPWVIAEDDPAANLNQDAEGKPLLEIKFSVIKEEHAMLVERQLQGFLKKKVESV